MKIQGYRIELGEIEARLKQHPQVKDAVVIAHAHGAAKQLLGYVVDRSDWAADAERQAFIASQPGCRRDLDQAPAVALPPPSSMLRLRTSAPSGAVDIAAAPTLMQLADLLAPLAAHRHGELPLPKRHYGSAGGLYPVQAYLQVGAGSIDGLAAGAYYYDPLGHGLRRIGEAGVQAREVQLQLVAEQAAIAPLYGDTALDFSRIEAGYMATLLASHCPDDMMLAARVPAVGTDDPLEALQLRASQVPLIGFRLRCCRERTPPRRELALLARKSYRRFAAHSLDDTSWQALARTLARDPHGRSLQTLGWRRDGGTCWLLDAGAACWQPLSTQADPQRLFPGNADVVREAGFAVIWIGAGESAGLDAGRVAQQLAHDALALDLGTCAIGETDDGEVARVLGGQADGRRRARDDRRCGQPGAAPGGGGVERSGARPAGRAQVAGGCIAAGLHGTGAHHRAARDSPQRERQGRSQCAAEACRDAGRRGGQRRARRNAAAGRAVHDLARGAGAVAGRHRR